MEHDSLVNRKRVVSFCDPIIKIVSQLPPIYQTENVGSKDLDFYTHHRSMGGILILWKRLRQSEGSFRDYLITIEF